MRESARLVTRTTPGWTRRAGATASATLSSGAITGITVTDPGSGYDEFTVAQITASSGSGASLSVNVGNLETVWARVTNVIQDGLGVDDTNGNSTGVTEGGLGSIVLNKEITNNARLKQVWPVWNSRFSSTEKTDIANALSLNQYIHQQSKHFLELKSLGMYFGPKN